ncbi:MAG: ABC transporter substrate-binding protein [Desulfoprunum sp.]|nr:ABC transporter substrate-binding protein [Desulfoprunum sp.]
MHHIIRFLVLFSLCCTPLLSGGSHALASSESKPPDTLVLAIGGEDKTGYDPTLGWGRYGSPMFQSTLLKFDADMKIVNDLATAYSLSKDGLVWTIDIRHDVKFSNNTPLTAEDVAFTFNTAAKSGGLVDLAHMAVAKALDRNRVQIALQENDSTFINRLITLGIVPKNFHGPDYPRKPIGSGPYMLEEWNEGQQMIVKANPYYYGAQPFFKRIVFLYTPEDTSFAAAKAGQVQMAAVPAMLAKQHVPGMTIHAVKSVDNRGLMFPTVPDTGKKTDKGYSIGNNVTADPAIRRAITIAIDRKALVQGVLEGYGRPAYGVCDGLPWDNPNNSFQDNDQAGAATLLQKAGWIDSDGDGIREKKGLKAEFTIIYPANRSERQYMALSVADTLKKIGIQANVEEKPDFDEIQKVMHKDVVVFGWGAHDPMELYQLYNTKFAGVEYNNVGYYSNPQVDENLEKAISARNLEEAIPFWQAAQVYVKEDAPWAWMVNLDHTYFVNDHLDIGKSQIEPHGHGWPITANIHEWKWKK